MRVKVLQNTQCFKTGYLVGTGTELVDAIDTGNNTYSGYFQGVEYVIDADYCAIILER